MFLSEELKFSDEESILTLSSEKGGFSVYASNLTHAVVNHIQNVVVLTIRMNEKESVRVLDLNGQLISDILIPENYKVWYLSSSKLQIALNGVDNETSDDFGRNDWWFDIDIEKGHLTKSGLAY